MLIQFVKFIVLYLSPIDRHFILHIVAHIILYWSDTFFFLSRELPFNSYMDQHCSKSYENWFIIVFELSHWATNLCWDWIQQEKKPLKSYRIQCMRSSYSIIVPENQYASEIDRQQQQFKQINIYYQENCIVF